MTAMIAMNLKTWVSALSRSALRRHWPTSPGAVLSPAVVALRARARSRGPLRPQMWLVAATLWLLAGCGPGVGGTGVGAEPQLSSFGATAASVCIGGLQPALDCPASTGAVSAPGLLTGTATVVYADNSRRVRLRLNANRAELDAACGPLSFTGEFGQVPGQSPRFYGALTSAGSTAADSILVEVGASGLVVTVFGELGQSLLGPIALTAASADSALAACVN